MRFLAAPYVAKLRKDAYANKLATHLAAFGAALLITNDQT